MSYKYGNNYYADGDNNIYFNVEISNPLINGTASPNIIYAQHYENTTQSIVDVANEYYLSIVRFNISGQAIPLTVMQIINNQPNPNLTPYIVCLSYAGDDFPVNIMYVPTSALPQPRPPIPFQDYLNPYYNIFSYQHVIDMVNTALSTSFFQLKTAHPECPSTSPPFLIFNPVTQLLNIIVENSYMPPPFSDNPGVEAAGIFFNTILVTTYLSGFEMFYEGEGVPNSKNYKLTVRYHYNNAYQAIDASPVGNANICNTFYTNGTVPVLITQDPPIISPVPQYYYPPTIKPQFLSISQDYPTLQNWSSFKSIVFTSSTLPVNSEFVPQTIAQALINNGSSSGAVSFRPILTDFQISFNAADNVRQQIEYFPQGPYRIVDLIGSASINKFEVSVWWTDLFDNLRPIIINPNQSASIKFLFIRKSSYISQA